MGLAVHAQLNDVVRVAICFQFAQITGDALFIRGFAWSEDTVTVHVVFPMPHQHLAAIRAGPVKRTGPGTHGQCACLVDRDVEIPYALGSHQPGESPRPTVHIVVHGGNNFKAVLGSECRRIFERLREQLCPEEIG